MPSVVEFSQHKIILDPVVLYDKNRKPKRRIVSYSAMIEPGIKREPSLYRLKSGARNFILCDGKRKPLGIRPLKEYQERDPEVTTIAPETANTIGSFEVKAAYVDKVRGWLRWVKAYGEEEQNKLVGIGATRVKYKHRTRGPSQALWLETHKGAVLKTTPTKEGVMRIYDPSAAKTA